VARFQDLFHFFVELFHFFVELFRFWITWPEKCGTVSQKVGLFHFVSVFLDTADYYLSIKRSIVPSETMLVSLGTILRFIFLCRFPYNVLFMNV
jgi:hypothetical protein